MSEELTEVQLQVLSAVRDEGLPTNDVAVARRTGLSGDVVRQALLDLADDHLDVVRHTDDPVAQRVEVRAFTDAGVARPPTKDWQDGDQSG
jgi:hypothetical protein